VVGSQTRRGLFPLLADRTRVPEELRDLIRRAYRTRKTRARVIIDDCLARLPHYRGLSDSLRAEIWENVLHHLALVYRVTLETGRSLNDDDLALSRRIARLRASQGVPLGEFLTFFHVGLTVVWNQLIDRVGESPVLRTQLLDRLAPIITNETQLITALTEAYVEERERMSRFREQDLDDFFQLLLSEDAMENVLEARARSIGIPLDESRSVAIFGPASAPGSDGMSVGPDDIRRELAARMPGAETWFGRAGEGMVGLIPEDPDPDALAAAAESLLGADGRAGLGAAGTGIAGWRRSAREAVRAFGIGAILRPPRRVHRYAEVAVLDLVGVGSAEADDFVRRVLGSLSATRSGDTYLETLRQLSANGYRIKPAAAALSVHPHTLTYRVKQIRHRFDLDIDDPEVRLRVQLALLILDA
jgi:sugar diacid utilization regulator